jgi:Cu(I)/Ag(I) efflux system periplasmic protein CusF
MWSKTLSLVALLALTNVASAQDTEAEVRKIDKAQMRITLKHAEIKKLDMPPMTMVFRIKDAKLLDGVAVGDKVLMTAEQIDGHYTVIAIQKKQP